MSDSDETREAAPAGDWGPVRPEAAGEYEGPGYPTVTARRKHLRTLAFAAGAAAVGGGLYVAGAPEKPGCGGSGSSTAKPGVVEAAKSWLSGRFTSEPPPRAAGGIRRPPPREEFPKLAGEIAMPVHELPPGDPVPDPRLERPDYPNPAGGLSMPIHEPEDEPRIKGDMVSPRPSPPALPGAPPPAKIQPDRRPEHEPRLRGRIATPMLKKPVAPLKKPVICIKPTPPAPETGETPPAESGLRTMYLSGATAAGAPFSVMIRLDQGDEASYKAVIQQRKAILTALTPLVGTPELARDKAASKLVSRLVPGAVVRFAGVVR